MKRFEGYLLASDIDGTLLANDKINPRNIEAIRRFIEEGGVFALSTGRGINALSTVMEAIGDLVGPSVVSNGTTVYDFQKGEAVIEKVTPDEVKDKVFDCIDRFESVGIELHQGTDVYCYHRNNELDDHAKYEGFVHIQSDRETAKNIRWNKALCAGDNDEELIKFSEELSKISDDIRVVHSCAVLNHKLRNYYEILPKGVSKASALKELCNILNIKEGGFLAIGDYFNDIEMLKAADIAACPDNAIDEVKAICKFIGGSAENGGVADFIEYIMK